MGERVNPSQEATSIQFTGQTEVVGFDVFKKLPTDRKKAYYDLVHDYNESNRIALKNGKASLPFGDGTISFKYSGPANFPDMPDEFTLDTIRRVSPDINRGLFFEILAQSDGPTMSAINAERSKDKQLPDPTHSPRTKDRYEGLASVLSGETDIITGLPVMFGNQQLVPVGSESSIKPEIFFQEYACYALNFKDSASGNTQVCYVTIPLSWNVIKFEIGKNNGRLTFADGQVFTFDLYQFESGKDPKNNNGLIDGAPPLLRYIYFSGTPDKAQALVQANAYVKNGEKFTTISSSIASTYAPDSYVGAKPKAKPNDNAAIEIARDSRSANLPLAGKPALQWGDGSTLTEIVALNDPNDQRVVDLAAKDFKGEVSPADLVKKYALFAVSYKTADAKDKKSYLAIDRSLKLDSILFTDPQIHIELDNGQFLDVSRTNSTIFDQSTGANKGGLSTDSSLPPDFHLLIVTQTDAEVTGKVHGFFEELNVANPNIFLAVSEAKITLLKEDKPVRDPIDFHADIGVAGSQLSMPDTASPTLFGVQGRLTGGVYVNFENIAGPFGVRLSAQGYTGIAHASSDSVAGTASATTLPLGAEGGAGVQVDAGKLHLDLTGHAGIEWQGGLGGTVFAGSDTVAMQAPSTAVVPAFSAELAGGIPAKSGDSRAYVGLRYRSFLAPTPLTGVMPGEVPLKGSGPVYGIIDDTTLKSAEVYLRLDF